MEEIIRFGLSMMKEECGVNWTLTCSLWWMKMEVLFWDAAGEMMAEISGFGAKRLVLSIVLVWRMLCWPRSVEVSWGWSRWGMSVPTSSGRWWRLTVFNKHDLPRHVIWSIRCPATWTRVMTGSWGAASPSSTRAQPRTSVWLVGDLEDTPAFNRWTRTEGWPYSQCGIVASTK